MLSLMYSGISERRPGGKHRLQRQRKSNSQPIAGPHTEDWAAGARCTFVES